MLIVINTQSVNDPVWKIALAAVYMRKIIYIKIARKKFF